jgi:tetratricopeptide (TPR) repeat protein
MKTIIFFIAYVSATIAFSQNARDYINMAENKAALEDYRGAIIDYTKAIELDPNNANAYYYRGQ